MINHSQVLGKNLNQPILWLIQVNGCLKTNRLCFLTYSQIYPTTWYTVMLGAA